MGNILAKVVSLTAFDMRNSIPRINVRHLRSSSAAFCSTAVFSGLKEIVSFNLTFKNVL